MPHQPDCHCPVCRYRRGEGKGQAPRLSVRLSPEIRDRILHHPQGARAYLEQLVNEESSNRAKLYAERIQNAQNLSTIKQLEKELEQVHGENQIYADALAQLARVQGHAGTLAGLALATAQALSSEPAE